MAGGRVVGDAAVVVVEKLSKHYAGPPPVDAVKSIDLEVGRGEIFGLLGPNGAGKTTTMRMALGCARPGWCRRRVGSPWTGSTSGPIRPGPEAGSGS